MEKLILVVIGVLLVDIYLKLKRLYAFRDFFAMYNDVTNRVLVSKKFLTEEDASKALKEILNRLGEKKVKNLEKSLRSIGVNLK